MNDEKNTLKGLEEREAQIAGQEYEPDLENGDCLGNRGYVKLYRRVLDNDWLHKNPNRFSVYIHLLLLAWHQEREAEFGGKCITTKPGQFVTGRKYLAKVMELPETTIESILTALENTGWIRQQKSSKNRLITMLSWSGAVPVRQQTDNKLTTVRQLSDIDSTHTRMNKKEKKEEKDNKEEGNRKNPSSIIIHHCKDKDIVVIYDCDNKDKSFHAIPFKWEDFYDEKGNELIGDNDNDIQDIDYAILLSSKEDTVPEGSGDSTEPNGTGMDDSTQNTRVAPLATSTTATPSPSVLTALSSEQVVPFFKNIQQQRDITFFMWRDITDENWKIELRNAADQLVCYYHEIGEKKGYRIVSDMGKDSACMRKQLETMRHWGDKPNSDLIILWMCWYFHALPKKVTHRTGLYISAFTTSWNEFIDWAKKESLNIGMW